MLPEVQHNLSRSEQGSNNQTRPWKINLLSQCLAHLTAAKVLQEVGEALDDAGVFRTVSIGVTDEDFWAGPWPLRIQRCTLIG